MSDAINPQHYKRLPAEAIEIIEAMIAGAPDNKAAHLHGQAAKYDLRLWGKGKSLEDYLTDWRKHIWYALRLESHLLELIEKQKADEQQKAADLQSLKDYPFGKLKTASINSDTIPEDYRKLNDSLMEPRQLGDLRWSVSEKRYIEISGDEIGYANRDNWAACRKITGEGTGEVTGEVKPSDGWRWLERGEVIRKGDRYWFQNAWHDRGDDLIGCRYSVDYCPTVRRNRFEVGEKVMHINGIHACVVVECDHEKDQYVIVYNGRKYVYESKCLVPYIEETK